MKCFVCFLACLAALDAVGQNFRYTVEARPERDDWKVELFVAMPMPSDITFSLPAWAPGNYRILNFGQWIDSLSAVDSAGRHLPVIRKNFNQWKISDARNLHTITYRVSDIPEDSLPTLPTSLNDMNADHFFFNGTAVFGYIDEFQSESFEVNYRLPATWNVFCSLDSTGPGRYRARNYDELADSPVMAGDSSVKARTYRHRDTKYVFTIHGSSSVDPDSLWSAAVPFIDEQTELLGDAPDSYYFLLRFSNEGRRFGALEHSRSSAYYLFPLRRGAVIRGSFVQDVMSHEFFHLWVPKRIYPPTLGAIHYQAPGKINTMWFIEGTTEYYAHLSLVRSGQMTPTELYRRLARWSEQETDLSLEKLSQKASQLGVAGAMYTKGALVSFLLDVDIRHQTNNRSSMDDLIKFLNQEFGQKGKAYDDSKFIDVILQATGADVSTFYKNIIQKNRPIDYVESFARAGLSFKRHTPGFMGWIMDLDDDNRLLVNGVTEGYTAAQIGLESGDLVLSINGHMITNHADQTRELLLNIDQLPVGSALTIVVERNSTEKTLTGMMRPGPLVETRIVPDTTASTERQTLLNSLLTGKK